MPLASTFSSSFSFRSLRIAELFEALLQGPAYAKDLAELIDVPSREIYPRLKRYLNSFITVTKQGRINIYMLRSDVRKIIDKAVKNYSDVNRVIRKAEKLMERFFGRELDDVEKNIIRYLVDYVRKMKKQYLEGGPDGNIAEILSKVLGYSYEEISESLVKLAKAGILYMYPSVTVARKVRLSKAIL
ncbi:hypothetical protein AAGT10_14830 (plasmid) [Sulfolobus tengchongensis]|uniref:ArsR family transcriptional regulator n=1 Tax=Sulfolobus tengchongensis TaxID=207809 RepID=A0AAX4L0B5_9CREN